MNKLTKGSIAAAAAGVLLLGGLGSLAYWTDSEEVAGGELNSGSITLGEVTCTGWLHTADDAEVTNIVPGDNVYNDCATTLTLVGDNIGATLAIDDTSIPSTELADALTHNVELQDGLGEPIPSVTGEGETVVTAHIQVDFKYGGPVSAPDAATDADNTSQAGTAALDALTLVAVQTNSNF